ncbi:MAG TPA: hypothetical protein VF469_20050 [Kofleriaceae bacterium]
MAVLLAAAACNGSDHAEDGNGRPPPDGGAPGDAGDAGGNANQPGTVTVAVMGPGRITSTPAGIDCGSGGTACAARFTGGTVVLKTDDATTVRWGNACSGNGDCSVPLGADRSVTAQTFIPLHRTFDGPDHGSDACNAIAAGPGDSLVVAGSVQRFSQGDDAWAAAYDATGHLLWSYELSTPSEGHDRANGVVPLPDGGALVAGTWFSGSNTHYNGFVLDVTTTGAVAWSNLNELAGDDEYDAIGRDASGRLVLAGARPDGTGTTQAWVRALTPDSRSELWAAGRNGTAPGPDRASGVAIDASGDIVACGSQTNAKTGSDGWIAKYSPQGVVRWSSTLASSGNDWVSGIAITPDHSVAVVGGFDGASSIRVLDAAGMPRWDITTADAPRWAGVAVDAAGDIVVTGDTDTDLVVRKYTLAGGLIWQRTIPDARGNAVAVDSHSNILVCGAVTVAGNTDGLILGFLQ